MSELIDLDGVIMNAVQTAPKGVVNADTRFHFHQSTDRVHATYAGGRVDRGYLVGRVAGKRLEFTYCQRHTDGSLDGGRSLCELRRSATGLLQIVERFEWGSGSGTNVFQQLVD